jgi:FAD/FMN-containing dehydrogenase
VRCHGARAGSRRASSRGATACGLQSADPMTTTTPEWAADRGSARIDPVADRLHDRVVQRVAKQLREHPRGRPLSIKKRAVSHQVPKRGDARRHDDKIDLTELDRILAIDAEGRTCTAEPGVTFEDLVEATLRHGLVPIVVPELRTITIGGAVAGCSIESMSFRHGGFHDTCLEYEVVTTKGEVLRCAPRGENALIFQMMHNSFGTLGVLTKLTFRLVPARPYVHVVYERHHTLAEYEAAIRRHARDGSLDFMDGFVHAPDHFVLNLGRFVDRAPYTNRYDWTKVYYRSTATRSEDYLRTPHYFFRYDMGVTNVHPRSFVGRLLVGRLMGSTTLLRAADLLHRFLPKERPPVTVDLFVPLKRFDDFLAWYGPAIGHFPLWVVPYRRVRDYEWLDPSFYEGLDEDLFVDLAIYGAEQPEGRNLYREIEEALPRLNGIKTLISHNFYGEEEFWRIFHAESYRAVKQRTDPENLLRDLWSKTCRAAQGA